MIEISEKSKCCGCSACANICPKHCIEMISDSEGFVYPKVNKKECVNCNLCEKVCPIINVKKGNNKPKFYGCWNKENNVRKNSSSGGVFFLLCQYVIERKGIVFGSAFDENFNVYHTYSDNIEGCKKFRGSKYAQSDMGDCFSKAKEFLKKGRLVLFTGTPCQIAGLKSFLKEEYSNLITQDIVCHSVPSPLVWNEYKNSIAKNNRISGLTFRNKENGWNNATFVVEFENGECYKEQYSKTDYMKGFINGLYSRPSCYDCIFSKVNHISDITLGDFWGVDTFYPELYDNKGTSLLIVHSTRGKEILNLIRSNLKIKRVNKDKAVYYNPAILKQAKMNPNRDKFFKDHNSICDKVDKYYFIFNDGITEFKYSIFDKIIIKLNNIKMYRKKKK